MHALRRVGSCIINVDAGTVTLSATSTSVEEGEDFTITITLDLPGTGVTLSPPLTGIVIFNDGTACRLHKIHIHARTL